jgi:hypothetical protein
MIIIFWEMTPCGSYHLPEDDNHHSHRRGNLKSYKNFFDRRMKNVLTDSGLSLCWHMNRSRNVSLFFPGFD